MLFGAEGGVAKRVYFGGDGKTSTGIIIYPSEILPLSVERNFLRGWREEKIYLPDLGREFTKGEILTKEFAEKYITEEIMCSKMPSDFFKLAIKEREDKWIYNARNKPKYWKKWELYKKLAM